MWRTCGFETSIRRKPSRPRGRRALRSARSRTVRLAVPLVSWRLDTKQDSGVRPWAAPPNPVNNAGGQPDTMALRESSREAAPDAGDFDVEVTGLSKVYDLARG